MRIRKRFAPSSSSSLQVSDPQLNRPVLVVQQLIKHPFQEPTKNVSQPSDPSIQPLPRPSDQPEATESEATRWVFAGDSNNQEKIEEKELEDDEDEKWREEDKSFSTNDNDNKKENLLTQPSSYSTLVDGRWCEGDRVVPLKKRRGSYDISIDEAIIKAKMKSKTNKKCDQDNGDDHQEGVDGTRRVEEKKSKRGNMIMEGSRCSRVNGRGWRCCQQTLVGYSLCEHHLGKGRLRSMTSVRNASKIKCESKKLLVKQEDEEKKSLSSCSVEDHDHYGDNDNDDEKKKNKALKVRKKKMNLGMVKARSLSSLLGQTDNVVVAIVDNSNKEQ